MIEVMFPNSSGLDVHKKTVTACVLVAKRKGGLRPKTRTFRTTTAGVQELAAWLHSHAITHVVMESTGVYWKPVYNILDPDFEVWLANARHVKQVPGRKTDASDAEWLTTLMRYGLLQKSFIPEVEQCDLRDLTRYRTRLLGEKTAAVNRLHNILEDANIKLTSVLSDVQGVSARLMLEALIAGESDVEQLAELAKGRLRSNIPDLLEALLGNTRSHHRYMLREILNHIDELNARLESLNGRIRSLTGSHEAIIARLDVIPGVGRAVIEAILGEIGSDVEPFPSEKHLASWACICPGNNISANKRRSGKRRKGQKWLATILVEAAWAASRSKDTCLAAQFQPIRARRGAKRAAGTVAHSILIIVYHLLKNPEATFQELGGDYFLKQNKEYQQRRALKTLEQLGFQVSLNTAAG